MEILLASISGFGALVVLGLLIRNLIKRPLAIATAEFPSYMKMSYNMSHAVCLCLIVPWGVAAFNAANFEIWLDVMASPLLCGLILVFYSKRMMERQSPEIKEYAQKLGQNSRFLRVMTERIEKGK